MAVVSAKKAGVVKLGDLTVNRLGLGTNRIANNAESRAVLKRAIELDINFIDTAERYGQSQQIIGETLAPYPSGVVVATKGGWSNDNSPTSLETQIERSLKLLGLEQLPLWQLHRIDPNLPLEQTMNFLKAKQSEGKIRQIGLSEVNVEQIAAARKIVPIVSVQNHYNLETRQHEAVLEYCEREAIVFIPFFPLASGGVAYEEILNGMTDKYSATPIQIAIAWLLKRSPMMLPIPGTLSLEHLESNLAAADISLSDEDYVRLTKLT